MKKAFSVIELVFIIVMLGVMAAVAVMYIPQTQLQQAADSMINNIKYAKSLAQTDDRYYTMPDESVTGSIDFDAQSRYWQAGMWQVQFHMRGANAANSYSIYADTGRTAGTTSFDGRPMKGDLIAKSPTNKACLSGYSMNNLPDECKHNVDSQVRLQETYDVTIASIAIQGNCRETDTYRIYFDYAGLPYCGPVNVGRNLLPRKLTQNVVITLKRRNQTATICISKGGLIYGSNDGRCTIN